jgi:hypothetical protein
MRDSSAARTARTQDWMQKYIYINVFGQNWPIAMPKSMTAEQLSHLGAILTKISYIYT